jgi:hypothetical protein
MSNRERWIVYPLLFYALVMGFKATYQDPLEFRCRTIECQQLNVRMINGTSVLAALVPKAAHTPTYGLAASTEATEKPANSPAVPGSAVDGPTDVAPTSDASASGGPLLADFQPPAEGEDRPDTGEPPDDAAAPASVDSQ